MSEFFDIVTLALTGLLDITNQAIGILIAWTILGVPLLFILATFDFMKTLLEELGIKKEDDQEFYKISKEDKQKILKSYDFSSSDIDELNEEQVDNLLG